MYTPKAVSDLKTVHISVQMPGQFWIQINRPFGATAVLVLALAGNPVLADVSGDGAMRMEHDLLDDKAVPASAYNGRQTARAMDNLPISEKSMSIESNVELLRHIMEEGFNKNDMSVIHASFHEDYHRHGYGVANSNSLAEHTANLVAQQEAFDDVKFTIKQILGAKDTVAVYWVMTGVPKAGIEMAGVPKAGPEGVLEFHLAGFFRVANGKVAESTIIAASPGM